MYERFTDRARKVLQYANQEAVRRNHEFVGPEHILAGIVREGNGLACAVLKAKQVSLEAILGEVGRLVPGGPAINRVTPVPRALTPRARQVIELAMTIARELKCGYVGTEHLLLALAKEPETVAWAILTGAGITYGTVLDSIREIIGAVQPSVRQDGETAPLWIEWQHVVAALPALVRAVVRAAEEAGPQDLAVPVYLTPETAALIVEAKLALDGKSP